MKKRKLLCVILAAGKGTRMNSDLPKVLHCVGGIPMLVHVMRAAASLCPDDVIIVTGPNQNDVEAHIIPPYKNIKNVAQMGTGYAVRTALSGLDLVETDILVLFGDVPLVLQKDLTGLLARHKQDDAPAVTILGMVPENPYGYGRLVIDEEQHVLRVVEELDATDQERTITLCNSGMMVLRGEGVQDHLTKIENKNAKNEYYLLDILPHVISSGGFTAFSIGEADNLKGVNDLGQLAQAELHYKQIHSTVPA